MPMNEDPTRRKKLRDGVARARILLKQHLGWMPGFPIEARRNRVRWQAVPWETPGEFAEVLLDRDSIRRMEMTLSKLRHNFPRALPRVIPDVDGWLSRMDFLLEWLKQAIHQGQGVDLDDIASRAPLPPRWIARWRKASSNGAWSGELLHATLFLELTKRGGATTEPLDWVVEHAELLRGCDRGAQLQLCLLRSDCDGDALRACFEVLRDETLSGLPLEGVYAFPKRIATEANKVISQKTAAVPSPPNGPRLGDQLRAFLVWLVDQKPKVRNTASDLLALTLPDELSSRAITANAHAAKEAKRLTRVLAELNAEKPGTQRTKSEKRRLKTQVEVATEGEEFDWALTVLKDCIELIKRVAQQPKDAEPMVRMLRLLPSDPIGVRPRLLLSWHSDNHRSKREASARRHLLAQLGSLFTRRGLHPALKAHWAERVRSRSRHVFDFVEEALSEEATDEVYNRFVRLLEAVYYTGEELGDKEGKFLGDLIEFAKASDDVERTTELVRRLLEEGKADEAYYEDEIRTAMQLCEDAPEDALAILFALDNNYELAESVEGLGTHVTDTRLRRAVRRAVLSGNKKTLARLRSLSRVLGVLGLEAPAAPRIEEPSAWIDAYPTRLHEPLIELAGVAKDAEAIAGRILAKDFPDQRSLREQIEVMKRKVAGAVGSSEEQSLRRGLENLRKKLVETPDVSVERLGNLRTKLHERVDLEAIEAFLRDGKQILSRERLGKAGGLNLLDSFSEPPNDQLLYGILQLKGGMRKLGLRLLATCLEDPCCDFRDEPGNREFLTRLQDRGVHLEPWLSRDIKAEAADGEGTVYEVRFTDEIRDVLLMGFHFDTCLSPGSFNFFSTLANAIDINKRVVYGKSHDGKVIGRCLFTLTGEGKILTYRRYSHDTKVEFAAAVDSFASRLAEAMGTTVISEGHTPTLEAKRWYDDGAVPLRSRSEFEDPDGSVRTVLRNATPETLVSELEALFGSAEALREELARLLWCDEFAESPRTVVPLIQRFGFSRDVQPTWRLRIAVLAHRSGAIAEAGEILDTLSPSSLPRRLQRRVCEWCPYYHGIGRTEEVYEMLTDYSPTLALRLLRLTRPASAKSDAEETDRIRMAALARVHEALGRDPTTSRL